MYCTGEKETDGKIFVKNKERMSSRILPNKYKRQDETCGKAWSAVQYNYFTSKMLIYMHDEKTT